MLRRSYLLLLIIVIAIAGCSRYSVSINEKLVYEPPPLFSGYEIHDVHLRKCVRETIAEEGLTQAEQLLRLICPPGQIASLVGLEIFANLQQLGVADNRISDIDVLAKLSALQQLNLQDNDVRDFSPVLSLAELTFLNARGNTTANCESLRSLPEKLSVKLPMHCSS